MRVFASPLPIVAAVQGAAVGGGACKAPVHKSLSSAPDATDGRFIACRAGFYDPAVFTEGREVTFMGRVEGVESTRIGEFD